VVILPSSVLMTDFVVLAQREGVSRSYFTRLAADSLDARKTDCQPFGAHLTPVIRHMSPGVSGELAAARKDQMRMGRVRRSHWQEALPWG
jgi:hypothetical protein